MTPLTNDERALVLDVLEHVREHGRCPQRRAFRIKHERLRSTLDDLEGRRLFVEERNYVRPKLAALAASAPDAAITTALDYAVAMVEVLRTIYRKQGDNALTLDALPRPVSNESRLSLALLSDIEGCRAVHIHLLVDPISGDDAFSLGEDILDVLPEHVRSAAFSRPRGHVTEEDVVAALDEIARATRETREVPAAGFRRAHEELRHALRVLRTRELIADSSTTLALTHRGLLRSTAEEARRSLEDAAALIPILQNAYRERQEPWPYQDLATRASMETARVTYLLDVLDRVSGHPFFWSGRSNEAVTLEDGVLDFDPKIVLTESVSDAPAGGFGASLIGLSTPGRPGLDVSTNVDNRLPKQQKNNERRARPRSRSPSGATSSGTGGSIASSAAEGRVQHGA